LKDFLSCLLIVAEVCEKDFNMHAWWYVFRRVESPASTCCILTKDLKVHDNMSTLKGLLSLRSWK